MNITFTSSEIAELLGVTKRTFNSYVERGTLNQKIKNKGWQIVSEEKIGRIKLYDLAPFQELTIEDFANKLGIKKEELFGRYSRTRTSEGGLSMSKSEIARETGVERNTVRSWDKKLEEAEIIKKGEYVYRAVKEGVSYEITKEEYVEYWKCNAIAEMTIEGLYREFEHGLIDSKELTFRHSELTKRLCHENGYNVYKFNKYEQAINFDKFIKALYK